jgi:predicted AAA+ superfamily ATPase
LRVLERLHGFIVIDEIQRLPELFPILRVLVDKKQAEYLILGSASRDLIRQSSETLAGRLGTIELTPFQLIELPINKNNLNNLLMRGGFPRAYLSDSDKNAHLWLKAYIQTFLERDVPSLGFNVPPLLLRRFWMMLTHVHGQFLNMQTLGSSLGVSTHHIRQYLDILAGTFMIRIMPPWFENIEKRQTKTPKIYFRDTGILLSLLDITSEEALLRHPACGAVWEGFAMEQIIQSMNVRPEEAFFWRTQHGAELDLLIFKEGRRLGFEFKFSDAPKTTKSMHQALEDLKLDHLYVIYPGERSFPLKENITAMSFYDWFLELERLN